MSAGLRFSPAAYGVCRAGKTTPLSSQMKRGNKAILMSYVKRFLLLNFAFHDMHQRFYRDGVRPSSRKRKVRMHSIES